MLIVVAIIILLLLIVGAPLYIHCTYMSVAPVILQVAHWMPTIIVVASIAFLLFRQNSITTAIGFDILLIVSLPQLLFSIISIIVRTTGYLCSSQSIVTIGSYAAMAICIAFAIAMLYGAIWGWKEIKTNEIEIASTKIPPSFDGFKIVQFSDAHVGTYGKDNKFLERIVSKINALHPDLIVFTGDLVNAKADELLPFKETLAQLTAKHGVYSVLGNHDYGFQINDSTAQKVAKHEGQMKWTVLNNESRIISSAQNDSIAIIGVENYGKGPFTRRGDLTKALHDVPANLYKILLSHDPSHWQLCVVEKTDIDLTLSGHTHAAQFKIGKWSPAQWIYNEWCGLYSHGKQKLYVSVGTGASLPFRLGATPTIEVITLVRK